MLVIVNTRHVPLDSPLRTTSNSIWIDDINVVIKAFGRIADYGSRVLTNHLPPLQAPSNPHIADKADYHAHESPFLIGKSQNETSLPRPLLTSPPRLAPKLLGFHIRDEKHRTRIQNSSDLGYRPGWPQTLEEPTPESLRAKVCWLSHKTRRIRPIFKFDNIVAG